MDWFVLGMEPTKDKKAITAAYRQKLRQTNPEDHPEEFKALRAAYEEALALADREDVPEPRDESPVGTWLEQVRELYDDYARRIVPENWRSLVSQDVCQALDTRPQAEEALLGFLMERYFIPRSVWEVLEDAFHFVERTEELCETYPREFVEFIILNGIRMEQYPPYELFIPGCSGEDCDAYRKLYFRARQMEAGELGPMLEQMDALSEKHPFGEVLRMHHWMATGRAEEGRAGLRNLALAYPDCSAIVLSWATKCVEDQDMAQAKALAQRILETDLGNLAATDIVAKCLAAEGKFLEAKELLYDAIHACGGNPVTMNELSEQMKGWNEQLISQLEEKIAACPEDMESTVQLAWCYAQNQRQEKAMEVARQIDPEKADPFTYHNLMGKLHFHQEHFTEALEHLQQVEQLLRNMEPDGTAETSKRIKRLPEMLQIMGSCLMQMEQHDLAREKYGEALALTPDDPDLLSVMGRNLYAMGDYPYAVEVLNDLLRIAPDAWYAELMKALSLYQLYRDAEAYESVERALAMQGTELELYVLKMQICIRNGAWDGVHDVLAFLEESGAPADISTEFIKAKVTELEKEDPKEAFIQYQKIADAVDKGEFLLWAPELYYRMAVLMSDQVDTAQAEDREILTTIIEKGLSHDVHDADCLRFKAWLLQQAGQIREAIDLYLELDAKFPDAVQIKQALTELYYDNVHLYAGEALAYFEKFLKVRKLPQLCFYAAICKRYLGDQEGARDYYHMEMDLDPEDIDAYRGLAFIADAEGDYDRSLELLDQAIAIMEQKNQFYDWLVAHKVQVLRRLGRFEEALSQVDDMITRYQYAEGFQMKFDICCQFGLWGRANAVLEQWKQAEGRNPRRTAAAAKLAMLTDKLFKAAALMGTVKHKLPEDQILSFRMQLCDLECKHSRQILHMAPRVKADPMDDNALLCMAQSLWHGGQRDLSLRYAQKALERLDDLLKEYRTDEAILRTRRCFTLALLGREEEARAELAYSRKLPLCHYCEYGSCKDADIYEAMIEEVLGNSDKALELFRAGKEKWPDDTDFSAGIARLTKRGKKKC